MSSGRSPPLVELKMKAPKRPINTNEKVELDFLKRLSIDVIKNPRVKAANKPPRGPKVTHR
jgi:hypothetical protein